MPRKRWFGFDPDGTRGGASSDAPSIASNLSSARSLLGAVGILFLLLTLFRSWVLVGAGERAVVFNRFSGTQPGTLGEGLHLLLPWVQSATLYDVKSQTYTMSASQAEANARADDALQALTRDGLPVSLELSVRFHPDPAAVSNLHRNIGPDYLDKIVRPQSRSQVRMIVAQYPVADVYGARRAQLIEEINRRLRDSFALNNVVLDEALLRDVSFSTAFQAAIEQKQVAQEDVARMTFVLESARKERQRRIIEAQGEAESIRLKANALARNPGLTQYEYVQNLPNDARTVVTDGRTIVNLGDVAGSAGAAASATAEPNPRPRDTPVPQTDSGDATR